MHKSHMSRLICTEEKSLLTKAMFSSRDDDERDFVSSVRFESSSSLASSKSSSYYSCSARDCYKSRSASVRHSSMKVTKCMYLIITYFFAMNAFLSGDNGFRVAEAASACVCKSGECDWDDLVPENAAAGDTCDTTVVNGAITANILCEDSETNANDVKPTSIYLTTRRFDTLEGDIVINKCTTLTTFYLNNGYSLLHVDGIIEFKENTLLNTVETYYIQNVTSLEIISNPALTSLQITQEIKYVEDFIKIQDNTFPNQNAYLHFYSLIEAGQNGPALFDFDFDSESYTYTIDSANTVWSLDDSSFTRTQGASSNAIYIGGNTWSYSSDYVNVQFNNLKSCRGNFIVEDNVEIDTIYAPNLLAIWGEVKIVNNNNNFFYFDAFCKSRQYPQNMDQAAALYDASRYGATTIFEIFKV